MQYKTPFLLLLFLSIVFLGYGQERDSTKVISSITGSIGVTHNGISLIPSFSLEKPAAIFNMSLTKGRFSFDPEFTFSLEGRPWYALFWLRYKVANKGKFKMGLGTHLGLNYISEALPTNREPNDVIITERYLVGELTPTYAISETVSVGSYLLFARGFDVPSKKITQFITLNTTISNIKLSEKLLLNITPQVYYLRLYGDVGYYVTSAFTVFKKGSPWALSSLMNKVIKTEVPDSRDFLWNLTLTYSFGQRHIVSPIYNAPF